MSFEATIKASVFESFVENLAAAADEARIHLTDDGLEAAVVDPANVAMIEQELSADAFEVYDVDGETIGVNLGRVDDVVSMADDDELLTITFDVEWRRLELRLSELEATIGCIDPSSIREEPELPDWGDLPATVTITGKDLSRIVKATDLVADHATLGADESAALFWAEGEGDTDAVRVEFQNGDLEALRLDGDAESTVSLDYLKDVTAPISPSTTASIQVGQEFPVVIRHTYAELDGKVLAAIAPRIKS